MMFLKQLSMAAPSDERTLRSSSFLTPSFDPTPEDMTYVRICYILMYNK